MGNLNPSCRWPNCGCKTEQGDPCKYENPDFYINAKAQGAVPQAEYEAREIAYKFLGEVYQELVRARTKFPSSVCCLAALHEESGELAQAMLKHAAGKWPHSRIREEAVQVAAMAMRCALEGDPSLTALGYSEPNKDNQ